jgi:hypothetical protein
VGDNHLDLGEFLFKIVHLPTNISKFISFPYFICSQDGISTILHLVRNISDVTESFVLILGE